MVLRLLLQIIFTIVLSGCSAIGYVKYEEKAESTKMEVPTTQESEEKKYIVREYYLVPEEWWLEYPSWHWSFGFYFWEPYWWYPYYYTRCPGCYLYEPYVFKGHRKFEKKTLDTGTSSEIEGGSRKTSPDSSTDSFEKGSGKHRKFGR